MVNGTPATVAATLGIGAIVGVGLFIGDAEGKDEADVDCDGELPGLESCEIGDNGGAFVGIIFPLGVGVGIAGVEVADDVEVEGMCAKLPVYFSPNSPGANITTEQNPSVDVMSNVRPSEDLGYC